MKLYQKNRPINRPVLLQPPWWPVDIQALPPSGWCEGCGAEVYTPTATHCARCTASDS